jgi:DNA repair protein RadA/Sms
MRASGTVILPSLEGTRALLVELQSLVTPTPFGLPRRAANGIELNRLHMILAVLEKRARLALGNADVFVNVAGGMRVVEPAADLALALSVASSLRDHALPEGTVVLGELGLTGEVRRVGQLERRLAEAARRGFTSALIPSSTPVRNGTTQQGLQLFPVSDLAEALQVAFPASSDSFISRKEV